MKDKTLIMIAAAVGGLLLWRAMGQRSALASTVNQAAGPRLPALANLPNLPPLPSVSGAVPNMPSMPSMPQMPWMNGGRLQ